MLNRAGASGSGRWLAVVALTAVSAHLAVAHADEPPPGPYVVTEADDLDGDEEADRVTADPVGGGATEPGKIDVRSGDNNQLLVRIKGVADGGRFGFAAWASTDISADGAKDIIAGAPDEATGRVYVFHGPFEGGSGQVLLLADDAALAIQSPDADSSKFGDRVMAVPDLDDDGKPDIMVRAIGPAEGGAGVEVRTYFFSSATGAFIQSARGVDGFDNSSAQYAREGGGLPFCCGDITGKGGQPNGIVDVDDLIAVILGWGTCPAPPAECPADCAPCGDPNGSVDVDDMLTVILHWGACDYDGDGMPDGWELEFGLDPYDSEDGSFDLDEDGLTNAQEFQHSTDPFDIDTDGDGASDGAEVIAGSNRNDSSDGGIGPNSANLKYVMLRFGDQSCHNSELWAIRFNGVRYIFADAVAANCQEPPNQPQQCSAPWSCPLQAPRNKGPIPIARGQSYTIQMEWIQTSYLTYGPDYDWTCQAYLCNANGSNLQPLMEFHANGPGFEDDEWLPAAPIDGVFVDDPDHLMGEYWSGGPGDHAATAWLHAPLIRLRSMSFEDTWGIRTDLGDQHIYERPQWLDSNLDGDVDDLNGPSPDHRYPVPRPAGADLEFDEVRFDAQLGTFDPQSIDVTAICTHGIAFSATGSVANDDVLQDLDSVNGALPQTIGVDDEFTVTWAVTLHLPGGHSLEFTGLTGDVQLYRPRSAPLGTASHCHTVWDLACRGTAQFPNPLSSNAQPQQIIDRIWSHFADREVKRFEDDEPLTYYGLWNCQATTTNDLIKDRHGQCDSWAKLFRDALSIQAIDHGLSRIIGNTDLDINRLLVRQWSYTSPGLSEDPAFPYVNLPQDPLYPNNSYLWLFRRVDDLTGIAGQGPTPNPLSLFNYHMVVNIDGVLYDPSYGATHTNLGAFESAAMGGFAKFGIFPVDEDDVGIDLNGNGIPNQQNVPTTAYFIGQDPGGVAADNLVLIPVDD